MHAPHSMEAVRAMGMAVIMSSHEDPEVVSEALDAIRNPQECLEKLSSALGVSEGAAKVIGAMMALGGLLLCALEAEITAKKDDDKWKPAD